MAVLAVSPVPAFTSPAFVSPEGERDEDVDPPADAGGKALGIEAVEDLEHARVDALLGAAGQVAPRHHYRLEADEGEIDAGALGLASLLIAHSHFKNRPPGPLIAAAIDMTLNGLLKQDASNS